MIWQERLIYAVLILALMAINYGLTQRLIRQAGQPRMQPLDRAQTALRDVFKETPAEPVDGKVDLPGKVIKESFRIGV